MQQISATKEDYLRALYHVEADGKIRSSDVVSYMKLAKSTVTERLQALAGDKLIKYEKYSPIQFTTKGKKLAEKLTAKHRIIEVFLHDALKMRGKAVHLEAHRLEHAFSDEVIRRLKTYLGNPTKDPHGQPIRRYT